MNTLTPESFLKELAALVPNYLSNTFLVAVSGGVDSMVLVTLLKNACVRLEIAHVNYHLRGEDSILDQKIVEQFCAAHQIPCHIKSIGDAEKSEMTSLQNWARTVRYQFFSELVKERNLSGVFTAHHVNDEVETFLINLSRGSGLKGLGGIPKNENKIFRPLLNFSKKQLYDFAKANKIQFREDLSNAKNDYLRNFIRNEITPKLLETDPQFLDHFKKSINIIHNSQDFIATKAEKFLNDHFDQLKGQYRFSKDDFFALHTVLQYQVIQKFGIHPTQITKIKSAVSGAQFSSDQYHVVIDHDAVIVSEKNKKVETFTDQYLLKINDNNEIEIPRDVAEEILEFGSCSWKFDLNKLNLPLSLRRKKTGDYYFPKGMKGKKKVSKLFKDKKLSPLDKPKIWLLCDAENQILGILPFQQDRRFLPDESSETMLTLDI